MIDFRNKRQTFSLLALVSVLAQVASAQIGGYTITTIAGGGPPNGVASTSVGLSPAHGVAVDAAGNVYVAAQLQNRIYKAAPDGTLTTVAGNGTSGVSGDNGPASSTQLNRPTGVALDGAGNLYIADSDNFRIRKVSGGIITTVVGNGGFGFSGDFGPAINAQISVPNGLAFDASDNLYFADSNNNRVRKVDVGGVITTVAGNGTNGFSGDNGLAANAQLNFPWGVAVDGSGVYIGDGNNFRVRKVVTGVITTVAGNGIPCCVLGDNGPAVSAQLGFVGNITADSAGNLYIAECLQFTHP